MRLRRLHSKVTVELKLTEKEFASILDCTYFKQYSDITRKEYKRLSILNSKLKKIRKGIEDLSGAKEKYYDAAIP